VTRSDRYLVFDVGGTQLRASVCDGTGSRLADVARVDAPSHLRHPSASWAELRVRLLDALSALRTRLDPQAEIPSAVVAFPGPLDGERRILAAPTLWGALGRYPYAFEREVQESWRGVDVCFVNDVTAAGYRYLRSEEDDFCIVTISSGIGNKVFVRGRPLVGGSGLGGEIGHLQVDAAPSAPICDCGARGHLGAIASGRGTLARARERAQSQPDGFARSALAESMRLTPSTLSAEALATAYRAGDPWTEAIVRPGADALAMVLATIRMAIGVERVVLIGGFSVGLGSRFCDDVRAALERRCWDGASHPARVVLGEEDGHCALVGAGRAKHLGLLP
jgi:C7-cyclitol 7-kinase